MHHLHHQNTGNKHQELCFKALQTPTAIWTENSGVGLNILQFFKLFLVITFSTPNQYLGVLHTFSSFYQVRE